MRKRKDLFKKAVGITMAIAMTMSMAPAVAIGEISDSVNDAIAASSAASQEDSAASQGDSTASQENSSSSSAAQEEPSSSATSQGESAEVSRSEASDGASSAASSDSKAGKDEASKDSDSEQKTRSPRNITAEKDMVAPVFDGLDLKKNADAEDGDPQFTASGKMRFHVSFKAGKDDVAIAGDSVKIKLPADVASFGPFKDGDTAEALETVSRDGAAVETGATVGTWSLEGATLTLTLGDLSSASKDAQAGKLSVDIAVPVKLKKAALGKEATQKTWTMATQDGEAVTAVLDLPAVGDVAEFAESGQEAGEESSEASSDEASEDIAASSNEAGDVVSGDEAEAPSGPLAFLTSFFANIASLFNVGDANDAATESEVETTYELGDYSDESYTVNFADNANPNRPATDSIAAASKLTFKVEGDETEYEFTWENARDQLHMTQEQFDAVSISGVEETSTKEVFTASDLPAEFKTTVKTTTPSTTQKTDPETGDPMVDEEGNPVMEDPTVETETTTTKISWSLTPDFAQWTKDAESPNWDNNYLIEDQGKGVYQANLTLVREFHFRMVEGGVEASNEQLLELLSQRMEAFDLTLSTGGTYNLKDVFESSEIEWDYADGLLTIYNLPAYTLQGGQPIDCSIKYTATPENPTEKDGDYWTAVYNNAAAPNHGADDEAVFAGGTLSLVLSGITDFNATKTWVDTEEDADRSTVTYKLYRYRAGQSFANASPVVGSDGYITVKVTPPDPVAGNSVTIDESLNADLSGLPKYDPEGYEYYYELRPETGSDAGYESIYGTIDETGANNYDDTLPAKVDSRDGHDAGIYDGGTLTVRRSGTTSLDPTKTWRAAAFQNQLANVTCIFTLQRSSDEGTSWSNVVVDDVDVTCSMGSFSEEQLTKHFSDCGAIVDWPAYDELGRPLEYRWVESSVKQGETDCAFDSTGENPTFTLTLKDPVTGADVEADFVSTIDPDTGNITNAYVKDTTLAIKKYWYAGNDDRSTYTQDPQAGENGWEADADFAATFVLYQDGKKICELTADGVKGTVSLADELGGKASCEETTPYNLTLKNVPLYNNQGQRHSYLVMEKGVGTPCIIDRVYNADTQTTSFYNRPAKGGEASEINVSKRWNDAGDGHGDAVVKLELVANHDLVYTKEAKDDQGNVLHNAGDTYISKGEVAATAYVSAKTEWFDTVEIPVGGLSLSDFTVREASVTMNGVESEVKNGDDEIKAALEAQGFTVTDNDLAMFPNHQAVIVNSHVYSVGASTPNGMLNSLEVTNTRVGWTNLSASKTWIDEGADKTKRPDCSVTLSVTSGEAEVVTGADGAMSIRSYGVDYPVMVSVDGADAVLCTSNLLTMLKDQDAQTWTISYLPKYDKYGNAITYSLSESCDDLGDYQSSYNVTGGSADGLHYTYTAGYDFTNQRAISTSATFTKKWRDDYVYSTGMRPDIFLTLYQRDSDGFKKVDGFIDVKWGLDADSDGTGTGGSSVISTSKGTNLQTITINDLPKYDSKGALITYYASESMSVNGSDLNYKPVYYDEGNTVVSTADGTELTDDAAQGDGTAVENGGSFNNDIEATQSVKGEKAWADVPMGFLTADFPAVTITVKHNQPSHKDEPDVLAAVIHLDPSTFNGSRWSYETGCMTNADGDYIDANGNVVTSADQAAKFPMFDEYGKKYTYYVQEYDIEIDPDAPVVGEVDQAAQEAGVTPGSIIYKPEYDKTGKSFRIVNTYQGGLAKNSLDVTKVFDQRVKNDTFPAQLTFKLYRTYYSKSANGGAGGYITPQYVDQLTMKASDFKADSDTSTATKTFKDLEIYAPNGYLWEYYVEESSTDAYVQDAKVTSTGDENPVAYDDLDTSKNNTQAQGATAGLVTLNKGNGAVEFSNHYTPKTLTLTGAKVWDDQENAFGLREQFLTDDAVPADFVTLKRTNASGNMTEDVTLQTTDPDAANYIKWDTTGNGDATKWTYAIENLEYWSPDSTAWTYTVTERDVTEIAGEATGYKAVTKTATCSNEAKNGEAYEGSFADLKNALDGTVKVTKTWNDGDTHSLRPTSISVKLQARYAGEAWADADVVLGALYATEIEQSLTGDGMNYTWQALPVKGMHNGAYTEIEYRVVETQIGAAGDHEAITPDIVSTDASATTSYDNIAADCYTVSATTKVEGKKTTTAITNSRDYVNLTVTKTWTDFDNQWGTRPENDSVTMAIQSSTDGGASWSQVKKADGSDLTITLTSNKRTTTVGNLVRVHDGTPILYRAIEETGADSSLGGYTDGYRIGSTGSYADATDFAGGSAATAGTAKDPASISEEVNNSLKYVDVTGTKSFGAYENKTYYDPTAKGAAPTMHVWRTTDGANWEKAYLADGTTEPTVTWSATNIDGLYDFKIANLPAADNQGNEYTYQVSEDETWANNHGFVVTQDDEHGNKTTVDKSGDTVVWTANEAITNTPTKFRIDKNFSDKIYTDMSKVSGGTYTLTGAFADGSTSKTIEIAAVASKSSSVLDGLLIPGSTYTLTETVAPDGYKTLGAPVTVEVDSEGSISTTTETQINGAAEGTAVDGVSVLMVVDDPIVVQLSKVIEGSTDKSGVAFTLTPADATNGYLLDSTGVKRTSATYTTDENGSIIMTGLVAGQTYTLTEASSPYPNALLDAYSFTVNGDGTVTPAATSANWSAASFEAGAAMLTATDPYISLALKKLDADGNEVSTDGRVDGSDATGMGTWTITPKDSAAFADGTTDAQTLSYEDGLAYLKHGCSYTVVEASAPYGYELNGETLTVKVSDTGVISIASDADDTAYAVDSASRVTGDATGAVITLKDSPTQITLSKVSAADNAAVTGAKFQVEGWFADGSTSKVFSTGTDASSVTIMGLATGKEYTIVEYEAPYGYECESSELKFTLNADGSLSTKVEGANANGWSIDQDAGGVSFIKADEPIVLTFVKRGDGTVPVADDNTTWQITGLFADMAGEAQNKTVTVTGDQFSAVAGETTAVSVDLSGFITGETYTVQEITAPAGYKVLGSTFTFVVNPNGSGELSRISNPSDADTRGSVAIETSTSFSVTDMPIAVSLSKLIEQSDQTQAAAASGVTFTVTAQSTDGFMFDSDGNKQTSVEVTTGDDGTVTLPTFVAGQTYKVSETSSSYANAMVDDLTFSVNADGTLAVTDADNWAYEFDEDAGVGKLTATDPYISLALKKLDADGNEVSTDGRVNGSDATGMGTWTITPVDDSTFADGTTDAKTLSYEDGLAYLKHGCSYTVVEASAPYGYELSGETLTVKVSDTGVISIKSSAGGDTAYAVDSASRVTGDATGAVITLKDSPTQVALNKVSAATGNPAVTGATFQVTGWFADGSTSKDFSTGADASSVAITGLRTGVEYEVTETAAPYGYELEGSTLKFTLNADGTLDKTEGADANGWSIDADADGVSFIKADEPIEASLSKKNEDGSLALEGAKFEVTGIFASAALDGKKGSKNETLSFTTGEDGTVDLLRLVAGESYTVHEATPPAGYVAGPDFTIEVSNAGVVSIKSKPDDAGASVQDNVITVNDERTNPLMGKCAFSNDNFYGAGPAIKDGEATFTFKGVFADSADGQTKAVTIDASKPVNGTVGSDQYDPTSLVDLGFIVGNTYEVAETSAPSGYAADPDTVEVKVKPDGTFEFVNEEECGLYVLDDSNTLISRDLPIVLTFNKKGLGGNSVTEYCEYQIWPADGSAFADGTTAARTIRLNYTEPDNAATFDDSITGLLANNTYVMKELVAPAGYAPSDVEFSFTVNMYGCAEAVESVDGWGIGQDGMQIQASDVSNSIEIYKVSGDQPLAGAEFTLVDNGDADGNNKAADVKVTTSVDNYWPHIDKLLCGHTYTLTETAAPAGFAKASGSVTVSVSDKGVITFAASEGADDYWQLDADNSTIPTIVCTDKLNKVQAQKVAPVVGADGTVTYQPLVGVELKLSGRFVDATGQAKNSTQTFSTDEDGYVTFTGVVADSEYEFSETSTVDGYSINTSKATVKWDADGNCTIVKANGAPVEVVDGALRIKNDPTSVKVLKTDDSADANPLAGAVFTITPTRDSAFADGTTAAKTITTGEDGTAELSGQLVWGGFYTIQETTAAAGYKVNSAVAEFHVPNNGKPSHIIYSDGATGWSFNDGVFTVVDKPVTLTIKKADGTTALSGAKFSIAPVGKSTFADGTTDAKEIATGADGTVSLDATLVAGGTYELTETEAPVGYILPTGDAAKLTLSVSNAGAVSVATGEGKGTLAVTLDAATSTLTVSDEMLSFTITKKSAAGGEALKGAEFKVAGTFLDGATEKTFAVDNNGNVTVDGIKAGETYTVTETKAPVGFAKATGSFTFLVDANNKASIGDYQGGDYASAPVTGKVTDPANGTVGCTFLDKPLEISLSKALAELDGNDPAIQNASALDGVTAAGTTFYLVGKFYSAQEKKVVEYTAQNPKVIKVTAQDVENGSVLISGLVAGEAYTLTEVTAPKGYDKAANFTFTMNADADGNGDNTITATDTDDVTVSTDGPTSAYSGAQLVKLNVTDNPLVVTLNKFAAGENGGNDTALNGPMEYRVTGAFMVNGTKVANSIQTVTVAQGANSARLAGLIEGESYVVEETAAPTGYASMTTALTATVTDGALVFNAGDQWKAAVDNSMGIDLVNKKTSVSFEKFGPDATAVSGCVLTLTDKDNNQVDQWTTDGTAHVITGKLVEGQKYTLTETAPAAGYATADPVTFTVGKLNGATQSVTMTDAKTSLKITKVDADGKALANCVMQVTHEANGATVVDEEWTTSAETGKTAHSITGKLVEGKEYTLTEATPAPGYTKAADQTFTVAAGKGAVQSVSMENVKSSFSLTKTDEDGTGKLAGSKFELTGAVPDADSTTLMTADTNVTTIEPGADGTITLIGKLIVGKSYTLKETVAPKGYKLDQGTFAFKVEDDGSLTVVANDTDTALWSLGEGNAISLKDVPVNLSVKKLAADGATALSGTTFAITPKKGSAFADGTTQAKSKTTGAKGTVGFEGELVEGGKYTISETVVPAGYTIAKTLDVTVDSAQGGVVVDGTVASCWSYADGLATLTNAKTTLSFAKANADATPLPGATFTVTPATGSKFAAAQTDNKIEVTSADDGTAALDDGLLVIGNTYNVTETTAPKGYLPLAATQIKVADDGTLSFVGEHAGWTLDGNCLKASDKPVSVTVSKFEGETSLEGYTIKIDGPLYEDGVKVAETKTVEVTGSSYEFTDCLETGVEYTLTELKAPANHMVAAGTCTFTVSTSGKVTIKSGSDSAFALAQDGKTIKLDDDPVNLTVTKLSDDATPKTLTRAEYTLTPATGSAFADGSTDAKVLTTGTNGKVVFKGLATGASYQLLESKAPEGYVVSDPITVTVNGDTGLVTQVGDAAGWTISDNGRGVLTNTDVKTKFSVTKVNADGSATLPGAVFTLKGSVASATAANGVTADTYETTIEPGDDGTISFDGLLIVGETYTITETKAPAGYKVCNPIKFDVAADGTITLENPASAIWTVAADGVSLTAKDNTIEASVSKRDAEDSNKKLNGAVFKMTGDFADGTKEQTLDTGNGSLASIDGLLVAGNTYTISETKAPLGYELCADATFKVNADGTLVLTSGTDVWSLTSYGDELRAKDVRIDATFAKTDAAGTAIYGAVFSVEPVEGSTFADGTADAKTLDTDISSDIAFNGQLVAGNTYTITETKAPLGYELCAPATFTVNPDGTLKFVGSHDAWTLNSAKDGLTAKDDSIKAAVSKTDEGGNALKGAVFEITPVDGSIFADASDAQTLDTKDKSSASLDKKLVAGNEYKITETKAPLGYELCADATFKVNADGTLELTSGTDTWTINADKDGLIAKDVAIKATVSKTDAGGNAVNGAVFRVTGAFADGSTKQTLDTATGSMASIEALLVANETYTLTETKAPLGYACHTAELSFTVSEQGVITFNTTDTAYELGANNAISLKDDQIVFTVNKVDQYTDDPLSGAEYTIKPKTSSDKLADGSAGVLDAGVVKVTTGQDGKAVFTGSLVVGNTYTLEETKAPTGYTRDTTVYELTVNPGGEVVRKPADALNDKDAYVAESSTKLTDLKTTLVLNNVSNKDGSELPQAHYVVKAGDKYLQADGSLGDEPYEFVTDENGKLDLTGVISINVDYVLEQVDASHGYKLNTDSFAFSLDEKGNVVAKDQGEEDGRYALNEDGILVVGADDPIVLNVAKSDLDGKALDDAVFTVTPAEGSAFTDGAASHELKVTADDPSLAKLEAQLIYGNTYVVSETKAPAGYELCADATVTVATDGTLTLNDPAGVWLLDVDTNTLTAKDGTMDMSLTKVTDTSDTPLEGAAFEIAGQLVGEDGSVSESTLTLDATDKNGVVDLRGKLVANETYTLTETQAPAGYKLTAPVKFTVDENGNATLQGNPAGWSVSETGADFKVADDPVTLVFSKVSSQTGKALEGAKFKVEGKLANGNKSLEFKTDEKGMHELSANLVLGEKYTLTETEAPQGYEKVKPATLMVKEDGSFELQGSYDKKSWSLQDDGKTLKVADEMTPAAAQALPKTGDDMGGAGTALLACGLLGAGALIVRMRRRWCRRGAHSIR